MRPPVGLHQVVGYVAPPAQRGGSTSTKKGVIIEVFDDGTARLDLTERTESGEAANKGESLGHHTALATFDPDKKRENSFHVLDQTPAASTARPQTPKPAGQPA